MKRLTRAYIEGIADRILKAYMSLPEIKGTEIYRIDPELLLTRVLGLKIEHAHLSLEKLYSALEHLEKAERELIDALFFQEMTEREYAKKKGVCRNTIHKRKVRILENLKKFLI